MRLSIIGIVISGIVLVVNPMVACSSSDSSDDWKFSESEMRAAVAGTYIGTYGTTSASVTLTLDEGTSSSSTSTQSKSNTRLQCSRSFIRPAAACITTTTMTVAGQISSSDGSITTSPVTGSFLVTSLDLSNGQLSLTLSDGSSVSASYSGGEFSPWSYRPSSGGVVSLNLTRR